MKDKNLPDDIKAKSLDELREILNSLLTKIETSPNLENSADDYQKLIKVNNLIEKKFQSLSKEISNNSKLTSKIKSSSEKTSEEVWELPINDDYMDMVKSKVADIKNLGIGRAAGTITAAAFNK